MNKKVFTVLLTVVLMAGYTLTQFTSCKGVDQISTDETPWLTFSEIRTASDRVLVAFFNCDTINDYAIDISNLIDIGNTADWKINGKPAEAVHLYGMQTDGIHLHVYLETEKLVSGKRYRIETPYGTRSVRFREQDVFCESIKTNQVGYSALSTTRYANFAIWLGTGGGKKIEGALPDYRVLNDRGRVVTSGKVTEVGNDETSGGYVYRIDLSNVPEGGPYKIAVNGYGSSYPFGIGGDFSDRLAFTIFRAQYLQRCGCPIHEPDIRKNPCHTIVYDVNGPIGEANIDVVGDEPSFRIFGGYHDAGDADRRAYHISNPIINLMIYETFPEYFTDGQFRIPGDFDENFNILNYENGIPDIIDEAEWGTLVWEYLQNDEGAVRFGTETRGYPSPFAAPLDLDDKKYGTVRVDDRATSPSAGLFIHLARIIKPYKPQKSAELLVRGDRAFNAIGERMAPPERLYYHIQRYLLTQDEADHAEVRRLYNISGVDSMKLHIYITPGYSLNDRRFDNPAYIMSYILEKDVPTDADIVAFFKAAIKDAADESIADLRKFAFPRVVDPNNRGWGHSVRQPQYAAMPLLHWGLTNDQAYFDAASEMMDYKLGLNPIGISFVTALGFHQVLNIHDRESVYTKELGWGSKPGITAFGAGLMPRESVNRANQRTNPSVVPDYDVMPKGRLFADVREIINFTEFTIFETMHYDALYTILAGGGRWNGENPFETRR